MGSSQRQGKASSQGSRAVDRSEARHGLVDRSEGQAAPGHPTTPDKPDGSIAVNENQTAQELAPNLFTVGVMNEAAFADRLSRMQSLLERVEHEIGSGMA